MEELLGLPIPRLHVLIGHRPGRRDSIMMFHDLEVTRSEPDHGATIELRCAADIVKNGGVEWLVVSVKPRFTSSVFAVKIDCLGAPVICLTREVGSSLKYEYRKAPTGESQSRRPATDAASYYNYVR
jgi:hypothetical protein